MKRERGTGRSSGTALGSPEPDLQAAAPTQSWDPGGTALDSPEPDLQAAAPHPELGSWTGLPAGLETDGHAPVWVEGPWVRRGRAGTCAGPVQTS